MMVITPKIPLNLHLPKADFQIRGRKNRERAAVTRMIHRFAMKIIIDTRSASSWASPILKEARPLY
jgi:hypothetical protein